MITTKTNTVDDFNSKCYNYLGDNSRQEVVLWESHSCCVETHIFLFTPKEFNYIFLFNDVAARKSLKLYINYSINEGTA